MSLHSGPDVIVIGKLIIDEHITTDGKPSATRLGGGSFQAAFGARAVGRSAGLIAPVGEDFAGDEMATSSLSAMGIDTQGVAALPGFATPRLEISYDGETMLWKPSVGWDKWDALQQAQLPLPAAYADAAAVHVLTEAGGAAEAVMALAYKRAHPATLLSVEPVLWDLAAVDAATAQLCELTRLADVVSPDLAAACAMAGQTAESGAGEISLMRACAEKLQLHATALLAVRCGAKGSYVFWMGSPNYVYTVGVQEVSVQDPTGAGNSYCGALAACLAADRVAGKALDIDSACDAVVRASAVGAAVVEVQGLPAVDAALQVKLDAYTAAIVKKQGETARRVVADQEESKWKPGWL